MTPSIFKYYTFFNRVDLLSTFFSLTLTTLIARSITHSILHRTRVVILARAVSQSLTLSLSLYGSRAFQLPTVFPLSAPVTLSLRECVLRASSLLLLTFSFINNCLFHSLSLSEIGSLVSFYFLISHIYAHTCQHIIYLHNALLSKCREQVHYLLPGRS